MKLRALSVVAVVVGGVAASAGCRSRNATDGGDGATTIGVDAPLTDVTLDATGDARAETPDVGANADVSAADDAHDTSAADAGPDDAGPADAPDAPNDALPVRGDALPPVAAGDTVCYASGWCWSYPTPLGGTIAVWAGGAGDVWVVGEHGVTRHFDGQRWTNVATPTTANLEAVWGAAADKVWAAGDDVVLFWDGTRWTAVPPPPEATDPPAFGGDVIRGASASDVWLASSTFQSAVWHFDGTKWSRWLPQFEARDVWVDSAGTTYVLPEAGVLARKMQSDPQFKTVDTRPFSGAPTGVWSADPNDIWMVYFDGLVHFDGSSWSARLVLPKTPPYEQLRRVAGSNGADVWFSESNGDMLRWNGVGFERWPVAATGLDRISLRSRDDVWAAGEGGALVHFDGAGWRRLSSNEAFGVSAVAGVGPDEVWAVGVTANTDPQSARYRPAIGWETIPMPPGRVAFMNAVWGSGPNDIWAVAGAYPNVPLATPNPALTPIYHWQDGAWTRLTGFDYQYFTDVWGAAANDVWIVGNINLHWDGAAWTRVATPNAPAEGTAISGTGRDDVWIVSGNVVHHFDGTDWSRSQPTTKSLVGVWARGATDVFAWSREELYRFDGQAWRLIHSYPINSSQYLGHFSVHGTNSEVWALTFDGGVERWDGTTWKTDEQVGFSSKIIRVTTRDVWLGRYSVGGVMRKSLVP